MGLVVKAGKYGYVLTFAVKNADGTAYNLSGMTVTFTLSTTEATSTALWTNPCVVVSGPNGIIQYTVLATDFPNRGSFLGEFDWTGVGISDGTLPFFVNVSQQVA